MDVGPPVLPVEDVDFEANLVLMVTVQIGPSAIKTLNPGTATWEKFVWYPSGSREEYTLVRWRFFCHGK